MCVTYQKSFLLKNRASTVGWDMLVAINRESINSLLSKQYSEKVAASENYPPFNYHNETYGLIFRDFIFGVPLISFENATLEDSSATIKLSVVSGTLIRLDSDKQVIQWEQINSGDEYVLNVHAKLKFGNGIVSEHSEITLQLDESVLVSFEGIGYLPQEVLIIFQKWLQNQPMCYTLGILKQNDSDLLYPNNFIVRTQRHPNATIKTSSGSDDGAMLLFIETNYGGKGDNPSTEYPWVIPDGKTTTLLIADHLIFGPLLAQNFTERVIDFQWETSCDPEGNKQFHFTNGYVPTTNIMKGSWDVNGLWIGKIWSSDSYHNERPARFSMKDFTLSKGEDGFAITGKFKETSFTDTFSSEFSFEKSLKTIIEYAGFDRSGTFSARPGLDSEGNVIFNTTTNFHLKATSSNWVKVGEEPTAIFASEASNNFNQNGLFGLASIKPFYTNCLLFPTMHSLNFSEASIPGDLALYGTLSDREQTLNVLPQGFITASGEQVDFSATLPDGTIPNKLIWSLDGPGNIDSNGKYSAPASGEITQTQIVIVTAKSAEGLMGTGQLTIMPSLMEVSTRFVLMQENAPHSVQFKAYTSSQDDAVVWSVQSDLNFPGSIDATGLYHPPESGSYVDGFNVVYVIATLPSGVTRYAIVCLWGSETVRSFIVEPGYYCQSLALEKVDLSTRNRDFNADLWQVFPAQGALSIPESHQEGNMTVWSSVYTAPDKLSENMLVMIKVSHSEQIWHSGYSIIELFPQ